MRLNEIFTLILNDLAHHGVTQHIGNGIILTGRGSQIPKTDELAKRVFNTATRRGTIVDMGGDDEVLEDPGYSACAGALKIGLTYFNMDKLSRKTTIEEFKESLSQSWNNIKAAIRW